MNLGDPMLEGSACDLILNLAITQGAFEGDELPPLESLGKFREISPGEDPMPFGSGFRSRLCRSSNEKYTSGSTTYKVQNRVEALSCVQQLISIGVKASSPRFLVRSG
jgi:hypothetical protein